MNLFNHIMRKTKIICTLGPATESPEKLRALILAGANVFRLNMSHAPHDWVRKVVKDIRAISTELGVMTGILMDTQGLNENDAFRRIQKMSMNNRKSMRSVAEAIILAHQVSEQ